MFLPIGMYNMFFLREIGNMVDGKKTDRLPPSLQDRATMS
jgi:hypothetical protein